MSQDIPGNSSGTFYMPSFPQIPDGTYGSAIITSTKQPIVVMVSTTKYASKLSTMYAGINY